MVDMKWASIAIIAFLFLAGLITWWVVGRKSAEAPQVASFADCVAAGYPIAERQPRQCSTPDGATFSEEVGGGNDEQDDKNDLIRVETPRANAEVGIPLTIKGEARGTWFFEASFPVRLHDANGKDIPLDPPRMSAKGDWMTEEFVSFEGTFTFLPSATETGTLVLMKDNPSGLPEHDDSIEIPIVFK